ncbi:MAG: NADH-quinone oxidoreductase subunit C [Oscillibacter sp.]
MQYLNTIEEIEIEQIFPTVIQLKLDGWRLSQLCATRIPAQYELSYSFVKGLDMRTLRLRVDEETCVPSLTQIYPCAFIQENEAVELFGVKLSSMEPDFHSRLYRIGREAPFKEKG